MAMLRQCAFLAILGMASAGIPPRSGQRKLLESDPILPASAYGFPVGMQGNRSGRDLAKSQHDLDYYLTLKFIDEAHLRADGTDTLVSAGHADDVCASQVSTLSAELGVRLHPSLASVNGKLEELLARAAAKSHKHQPDLRGLVWVELSSNDAEHLVATAEAFDAHHCVEYISIESKTPPEDPSYCWAELPFNVNTPDFTMHQTYRHADPGMDIDFALSQGGDGEGVGFLDAETGVDANHEDLLDSGLREEDGFEGEMNDHGTAVVSIVVGVDNGFGVTGIAPKADAYFFSQAPKNQPYDRTRAVASAMTKAREGDIVLLEMQTRGGNENKYGPAEYDQQIFDLVRAGVDAGVIVVEAAGNGHADLDGPDYEAYLARGDSGAIIVGAGLASKSHEKAAFSTYGSRVDVQGWGDWSVMAAGYGTCEAQGGWGSQNRAYRATFAGTSSASALVAGAVVALQSWSRKKLGRLLAPDEVRTVLKNTGVPQTGRGGNVGPHVNLRNAIAALTYYKADRAQNCPLGQRVESVEDCKEAGQALGYPFHKEVSNKNARPAGCFWDRNGRSYFNLELDAQVTWTGVGGICDGVKEVSTTTITTTITTTTTITAATTITTTTTITTRRRLTEPSYYKAQGGQNCPQGQIVDSAEECKVAGQTLDYAFKKVVSNKNARPSGCFWDRNGRSYFNRELDARVTWRGVGGICKQARRLAIKVAERAEEGHGAFVLV